MVAAGGNRLLQWLGGAAAPWTEWRRVQQLPIETTVYSMSPKPPAKVSRRADKRHLTLFRVGTVIIGGARELCLVKNISAGGALIRTYSRVETGQDLQIELKERQPVDGIISWVRGTDAGIEFARPVDVADLLRSSGEGPRPRMPRVEVTCAANVRQGALIHRVTVQNVSQGGLSVESAKPLMVGREVIVSLPGMPPQGAAVRWADGDRYGITFNTVLPLAGLVDWLHSRQGQ